MVRYIAVVILGCLYAAGATWLVRGQGQAYRDALQRERPAAATTEEPVPNPIEAVVNPIEAAVKRPGGDRPGADIASTRAGDGEAAPDGRGPPARRPRVEPSATVPAVTELAKAEPKPASPPPAVPAPGKVPDAAPRPANLDPIWDQAPVKKKWDLAKLTIADEVQIGRDFNDLVLSLNRQVQDASLQRRVEEAARPFLAHLARKAINYTFTILDSDAVNAFSAPGGFVYVCSGLFNLIGEDEDNALEFVVGHEMAHVRPRARAHVSPGPGRHADGRGHAPEALHADHPVCLSG